MTYVLNKYPNLSEKLFYLSIIIPTVVLFVTVIWIIICVEYTLVFQYTWDSWHPIPVCTNIVQFTFRRINANGGCKRLIKRLITITLLCHHAASAFIMPDPTPPPLVITQCWDVQMGQPSHPPPLITQCWDVHMGNLLPKPVITHCWDVHMG